MNKCSINLPLFNTKVHWKTSLQIQRLFISRHHFAQPQNDSLCWHKNYQMKYTSSEIFWLCVECVTPFKWCICFTVKILHPLIWPCTSYILALWPRIILWPRSILQEGEDNGIFKVYRYPKFYKHILISMTYQILVLLKILIG